MDTLLCHTIPLLYCLTWCFQSFFQLDHGSDFFHQPGDLLTYRPWFENDLVDDLTTVGQVRLGALDLKPPETGLKGPRSEPMCEGRVIKTRKNP